jgi:hypothetical protein
MHIPSVDVERVVERIILHGVVHSLSALPVVEGPLAEYPACGSRPGQMRLYLYWSSMLGRLTKGDTW